LYKWLKLFGEPVAKSVGIDHEAGNRRLKRELARVTAERDIPGKLSQGSPLFQEPWRTRTSRTSPSELRLYPGASGQVRRPGDVPGPAGAFLRLPRMA
jgi:hypothetical protein